MLQDSSSILFMYELRRGWGVNDEMAGHRARLHFFEFDIDIAISTSFSPAFVISIYIDSISILPFVLMTTASCKQILS